jgi:hypothetical protein
MSCEEVKAKLSLYVAADVERQDERERIEVHLRACQSCRAEAAEWEASRELLRLHAPPEFDALFFDRIRRDVLRQISDAPPPSLFARLLGQPFGQRTLVYAAAFSMLVCAVIISSHFLRQRQTPHATIAKKDKGESGGNAQKSGLQESGTQTHGGFAVEDEGNAPEPVQASTPRHKSRRPNATMQGAAPGEKPLSPTPQVQGDEQTAALTAAQGRSGVRSLQEPATTGVPSQNLVETASADRKMLRIELQTSDPNIRIIWLSPQPTSHASSNKLTDRR